MDINDLGAFLAALRRRHDYFPCAGLPAVRSRPEPLLRRLLLRQDRRRHFRPGAAGQAASPRSRRQFASFMMLFFGRLDAEKGWTKQLHLGALRNNNTRLLQQLGPDTGFDSIGDFPQGAALAALSGPARAREAPAQNDHLQHESGGQLRLRHDARQFSGRQHARQNPVRLRLVVPGPEGRHGMAAQRAVQPRPALALCRHGHRFALVHVLSAPRIFPPGALQSHRARRGSRAKFPNDEMLVAR